MDSVQEIKARLPIEDLVSQYCQLQKKGRNFVCLCPFHNDKHPSLQVSPDKGIAYCFACQKGGDIFSFYQAIENVDFRQALKELAEKTGVKIADAPAVPSMKKDEKERLRDCLVAALRFYRKYLAESPSAQEYLRSRGVTAMQADQFELGLAPDSFSETYEYLLKEGFSRSEIIAVGLGVQRDLDKSKIYDRFRHRLMFPIHDAQGKLVGFGGRTLGDDDAKYINSSDGPLYHKGSILYGFHYARESMRESKRAIMVEGYFDLLACHRVGVSNVVAVSGTALTSEHVKILRRSVETVVLCLDQDRAGHDAAERAFLLCVSEGLNVNAVTLPAKDPDEVAALQPELLRQLLSDGGVPYLDVVLQQLGENEDTATVAGRRVALRRLLPLLKALPSSVERVHYIGEIARLLNTTPVAIEHDLAAREALPSLNVVPPSSAEVLATNASGAFSAGELALALLVLYPRFSILLERLIPPEGGMEGALYEGVKLAASVDRWTAEALSLSEEHAERLAILLLYCEEQGLSGWSDAVAEREIRKNCRRANQRFLHRKQQELAQKMLRAQREGKIQEQQMLSTQYQEVLKLAKIAMS